MTTATTFPPCPRCRSTDARPILYGYPSTEMFEASERGDIGLGGCIVWDESPDFECGGCGSLLPWVAHRPDDEGDD